MGDGSWGISDGAVASGRAVADSTLDGEREEVGGNDIADDEDMATSIESDIVAVEVAEAAGGNDGVDTEGATVVSGTRVSITSGAGAGTAAAGACGVVSTITGDGTTVEETALLVPIVDDEASGGAC